MQLYAIINPARVEHRHLEHLICSVALDNLFRSLPDTAPTRQWERRLELLRRQIGKDSVEINDGVFMFDVQSLKVQVLVRIFAALGIDSDPVPRLAFRGLIDEVAERRSAVAHGRESAVQVGSQFRSEELRRRVDALSATSFYILGALESFVGNKLFVGTRHRQKYSVP